MIHVIVVEISDKDFHDNGLEGCRELIRCKKCTHSFNFADGYGTCKVCFDSNGDYELVPESGFCHKAERGTNDR